VVFLNDPSIIDTLSPCADEVDCIFSHPLEAILDPSLAEEEVLSRKGTENWPYEEELYVRKCIWKISTMIDDIQNVSDSVWTQMRSSTYRMHRFRSSASPIKGLTADILVSAFRYICCYLIVLQILVAEIAFAQSTTYVRYAPGQATGYQLVLWAIEDLSHAAASSTLKVNELQSRIEESAK